jgi:hypothetical protein
MIELHVAPDAGARAEEVRRSLDDLVVAYRWTTSDAATTPVDLPAIKDGDRWIGADGIDAYLVELRHFLGLWRKFQADACYLEDDGTVC